MADEFSCWLAVVGLPSANSKEQVGPGKSCLCNRFLRSKEDDYSEYHPSGISNQDFGGQVVNNENFLYWGYTQKTFDNLTCGFRIIEHTQFYDDSNFKPFGGNESYIKRAMKPKITTDGTKYQYIDYDHMANDEHDEGLEIFPCEKSEKVVIDAFIFVFDVSREDIHFVDQYNMAESFIKGSNKPLVLALSKYDEFKCKHIETIRSLTQRNKTPVVEISAKDNINIDTLFQVAAKLVKHGSSKNTLKNISFLSYEESYKILQDKKTRVSRLFNALIEKSVVDKNVKWHEFLQFCKNNKDFQNYCDLYGTKKSKSMLDRHIRNLTIKLNEKRKNLYLKDLDSVFAHFIDNLALSNHDIAVGHIRNNADFNDYFVALPEETNWKDASPQHSSDTRRILIPLDLLSESEAIICFDNRITELKERQEQIDLADEFERSLTLSDKIFPGLSLDDVLGCVDEKFSKLDQKKSLSIYNDHQVVITKQCDKNFEEMLLENTELFRAQLPGGDLKADAIASLAEGLKDDVRWQSLNSVEDKRHCLLLQQLATVVNGTSSHCELSSVEKQYKSLIVEKIMTRKELNYSANLVIKEEEFSVVMMSSDGTSKKWVDFVKQDLNKITVDEVEYHVTVETRDPSNFEIFDDSPVHLIIGLYCANDWASFRSVTGSFDKLLKEYRGIPCQIVYLPAENPTVTVEEGSRFAHRLNCELISEETFKDNLTSLISTNVTLVQHRADFVDTPTTAHKAVFNLNIRMLFDDDVSFKEISNSLFKFQFSFVHPYEPDVYVIHTIIGGTSVFVMVHLLHYLEKKTYKEHGCVLVCKDSRMASLKNARFYMEEYNMSRSLGLVVVQTLSSLPFATDVTVVAEQLGIQSVTLEQEHFNRRVSIGQKNTPEDGLLLHVLQNGVQYIGDTTAEFSEDTSDEEHGSLNDVSLKSGGSLSRKYGSLDRRGFASPPPHGNHASFPERLKNLSVSWNELRDEGIVNHPWGSMPRNIKDRYSLVEKTPPIYSVPSKGPRPRRRSSPHGDDRISSPMSPPIPPRPSERNYSETSSEGLDQSDIQNKSGGLHTTSLTDSPSKSRKMGKPFNKKKLSEEEVAQKRINKIKKREDKVERKRKAKERKQLEKNKKLLASWDPTKDIASTKSLKPNPVDFYAHEESVYFGHGLDEIAPWGGVPYYVSLCVEYLECHDLTIEGLYRKEGNKLQIKQLETTFEIAFSGTGETLSGFNLVELDVSVHVVASSVKKFFKRLPGPIIPHEFHNLLLAAVEINSLQVVDREDHVARSKTKVLEIINQFDRQSKLTVAYIIRHLSSIADLKDQNKMSSTNLAIIFWPTLLQPTQDVLMRNEDRTKFSTMVEFLIDNSDSLFGPELPSCPPPDDEDIYDMVFHPELAKQKTQEEYEYIKRPKTYFNQALRIGHVPSLVKQCLNFIGHAKISTNLYVQNAREDLVDNFVKAYEAAYTVDEHRTLNIQKVLKNLTLTRSLTDDSISASTNTDDTSIISSVSGDLSMSDSKFEETTMDSMILATVMKRYLSSLIVPLIPAEHHLSFLDISPDEETLASSIQECFDGLKQSHKILLSFLLEHLSEMKDKGVVQVEEVFAPIIFFGNTIETQAKVTDMMSDPSTPVSITYSPNMLKQERLIKLLIQNVQVFALKDGIALYAPLYESMDQERELLSPNAHTYSSAHYALPALPEETRVYDTPTDTTHYAGPLYSSISNTYDREPGGSRPEGSRPDPQYESLPSAQNPFSDPQYVDADELSELYEDDSTNTYVEGIPLPVRPTGVVPQENIPNR